MKREYTFYLLFGVCASLAVVLIIAFSGTLIVRAMVFVPLFLIGSGCAIYYITCTPVHPKKGDAPPCPPTRAQIMFYHLVKKRDYALLLQLAYLSYFFFVESVTGINVLKTGRLPDSAVLRSGIDPEFLRRARNEYLSLKMRGMKLSGREYNAKLNEILSHISMIENSKPGRGGKMYGQGGKAG